MKRDMDLIREILLALESDQQVGNEQLIEGYSGAEVNYHAGLLIEAGLADGLGTGYMKSDYRTFLLKRLTWEGHEFLEKARDPGRWAKAKAAMISAGGFSLPIMQELLGAMMKKQLGID